MIRIFVGTDTKKTRAELEKALQEGIQSGAKIERFSDIGFSAISAHEALYAQDLFVTKTILVFDGLLEHPDHSLWYGQFLSSSPHDIYIREVAPKKEIMELFERLGSVVRCDERKNERTPPITFALADAVIARDKQKAFALFHRAIREGAAPEEIHGVLFWALKSMFLVKNGNSSDATEGGVATYQWQKYLRYSAKWSSEELASRIRLFTQMFHDAHHAQGFPLVIHIERALLL